MDSRDWHEAMAAVPMALMLLDSEERIVAANRAAVPSPLAAVCSTVPSGPSIITVTSEAECSSTCRLSSTTRNPIGPQEAHSPSPSSRGNATPQRSHTAFAGTRSIRSAASRHGPCPRWPSANPC